MLRIAGGSKAALKKIGNTITEVDQFGTEAQIYFKKNHKSHKTLFGGLLTISVRFWIFAFTIVKFQSMFLRENNSISSYKSTYDVDKAG